MNDSIFYWIKWGGDGEAENTAIVNHHSKLKIMDFESAWV